MGLGFAWQMTGDTKDLEQVYRTQLKAEADREYINTLGSLWIDRIADGGGFNTGDLQRARLGGSGTGFIRVTLSVGNSTRRPATRASPSSSRRQRRTTSK